MFPEGDIADPNSNTAFNPSLEYSTHKLVLSWQPPFHFSPWSPSSFVVDDVPYSCVEQHTMVEKIMVFQDHPAVELIMSSPEPSTHKRIGRGVCNFDFPVGDREKQNAVLSGIYVKFSQNPAMKKHLLSSDNKLLAESSPLDPVWGIGFWADDPRANNPCQWRGTQLSVRLFLPFAKKFATVRPLRRTRPSFVGSPLALQMKEPKSVVRVAAGPLTAASAHKGPPSEFSTNLSDALADQEPGIFGDSFWRRT